MARGGKREGAGRKAGGKVARPAAPKLAAVGLQVAARRYTDQALGVVVGALKDDSCTNRLAAAKEILDRGWGKATQTTKLEGDPDNPIAVVTKIILTAGDGSR